jgi:hypothetical protein
MKALRSLKCRFFRGLFATRCLDSPAVFISHSSDDREQAALLVILLRTAFCLPSSSIRCTSLEGYRLACGADTDETLKREVRDCRVLIVLVSESSTRSAYVMFELGARWGFSKPLFPLLICGRGAELMSGPLKGFHALNAGVPGQLNQLVTEVAAVLDLVPEPPAVYQERVLMLADLLK